MMDELNKYNEVLDSTPFNAIVDTKNKLNNFIENYDKSYDYFKPGIHDNGSILREYSAFIQAVVDKLRLYSNNMKFLYAVRSDTTLYVVEISSTDYYLVLTVNLTDGTVTSKNSNIKKTVGEVAKTSDRTILYIYTSTGIIEYNIVSGDKQTIEFGEDVAHNVGNRLACKDDILYMFNYNNKTVYKYQDSIWHKFGNDITSYVWTLASASVNTITGDLYGFYMNEKEQAVLLFKYNDFIYKISYDYLEMGGTANIDTMHISCDFKFPVMFSRTETDMGVLESNDLSLTETYYKNIINSAGHYNCQYIVDIKNNKYLIDDLSFSILCPLYDTTIDRFSYIVRNNDMVFTAKYTF